jgi:hypothetical protein
MERARRLAAGGERHHLPTTTNSGSRQLTVPRAAITTDATTMARYGAPAIDASTVAIVRDSRDEESEH